MAAACLSTGLVLMTPSVCRYLQASTRATKPPVIEAVRVPPSACTTSQSMVIVFSPSAVRSMTERIERPIRRWISCVRPDCLPCAASRRPRVWVARGSMPYSPVTQPAPFPFIQPGTPFSQLAVHSTWVWPNFARQEPSAYRVTPVSREIGRN